MFADFAKEMETETSQGDLDYASYQQGLSREALIKVLHYDKKNTTQAKLPTKSGLVQEVLRWNTSANEKQLSKLSRSELIATLLYTLHWGPSLANGSRAKSTIALVFRSTTRGLLFRLPTTVPL